MGVKVGILVENDYWDPELWYPLLRFQEEGYQVTVIGPEANKEYKSPHGYPCTSDISVDDAKVENFDALIIPGGWCPDYLRGDERMVKLVQDMVAAGKVTAAICHGPWMLCSAKCIQGKRVTAWKNIKADMENAGGLYEDSSVVVDGNIITSRHPPDLPDFCKAVIANFKQ